MCFILDSEDMAAAVYLKRPKRLVRNLAHAESIYPGQAQTRTGLDAAAIRTLLERSVLPVQPRPSPGAPLVPRYGVTIG